MVNARMMSDSIVLWTDSDRAAEFLPLLMSTQYLLASAVVEGLPMRAAIEHGFLSVGPIQFRSARVQGETIVGSSLVRAYTVAESQAWSGGVASDDAVAAYVAHAEAAGDHAPSIDQLVGAGLLIRHTVPWKADAPDRPLESWAINWPRRLNETITEGELRSSFTDHGKKLSGPDVLSKFSNTLSFLASVGCLRS
jgi:hypothetical protein